MLRDLCLQMRSAIQTQFVVISIMIYVSIVWKLYRVTILQLDLLLGLVSPLL